MKHLFCVLLATLTLSAAVSAQEQRGSIEGTVRDSSGALLPGVTVEARSPALVGIQSTVTDANGTYRFPALAPGRYELTATLQNFSPAKVADVSLELGKVLKVDLTLAPAGVAETVQVVGETPLIDVKQNAAGANIQAEIIERIPRQRNYTALVTSAPGVTDEARNRGIQIDGASGADNRFMIDGVDTRAVRSICCTTRTMRRATRATVRSAPSGRTSSSCRRPTACRGTRRSAPTSSPNPACRCRPWRIRRG